MVDWLVQELRAKNFPADGFHSELSSPEREVAMLGFRAGRIRILVSTDIIAKGIEIPQVRNIQFCLQLTLFFALCIQTGEHGSVL
jgi:ATP-dependent RNA helicase RhlE